MMDPSEENIQRILRLHTAAKEKLQAELAGRTAARILYDDYLIDQMRKGKPFKIAHRKANSKFPSEALTVTGEDFAELEKHYELVLGMEQMDKDRHQVEQLTGQIQLIDQKIAELLKKMSFPPEQQPPE